MSDKLWDKKPFTFEVGGCRRIHVGGLRKTKVHIIGVVKDGNIDVVLYRWWAKHKKYWVYEAETSLLLSYKIRLWKVGDKEKKRIDDKEKKRLENKNAVA